jgi:thiamine-phosphate pyrophosphorylase
MIDPATWDVYLVTDRGLARGRRTPDLVQAAVKGGVSAVQLREKLLSTREFYEEGKTVAALLKSSNVPLIINDRIDVALALNADGVHLGQQDMPVGIARELLGPEKLIGLSVETAEHLTDEDLHHVDYLGVSPIFLTPTKDELRTAWGLEGLRQVLNFTDLPLVAIGSLNAENAAATIEAGAGAVAVVSAIVSVDDPEAATRRLVDAVRMAKRKPGG